MRLPPALRAIAFAAAVVSPLVRARAAHGPLPDWVHGAARYKFYGYPEHGRQGNDLFRNQGELDLELTPDLSPLVSGLRVEGTLHAVYDDEYLSAGAFDDRAKRRPILNWKEVFVAWESGPLEVRAGKQVHVWGKADLYNPGDLLDARDYVDLFDNEHTGNWCASARYFASEALSVEAVVIPYYMVPSRLPLRHARFDLFPPDLPFAVLGRDLPPDQFSTTQYGLRLSGTISALDLDWSASGYLGYDHEPNLRVLVGPTGAALEPYYMREDEVGFGLSRTFWRFEGHLDTGFYFHSATDEDDFVKTTVGLAYRDTALIDDSDELYAVVEYVARSVTDEARLVNVIPSLSREIFRGAVLGRVRYGVGGGDLTLEASCALIVYGDENAWLELKIARRLLDRLTLTVGADAFTGPSTTFFGQFRDDARGFLFLEATF